MSEDEVSEPILSKDMSMENVIVDKALLVFAKSALRRVSSAPRNTAVCRECYSPLEIGQKAFLVWNTRLKRRMGIYCTIACQRKGFFESVINAKVNHSVRYE